MSGIMCMILGSAAGSIGGTVATPNLDPNNAAFNAPTSCSLTLNSSGGYVATNSGSGDYCTPTSLASGLEAQLVYVSGDNILTGAAMNTWLPLSTTRTWTMTATLGLFREGVFTLTLRETVSQLVRDTSTITFSAESINI